MSNKIAIVDYGVGNLFNIERAIDSVGAKSVITSSHQEIMGASHLMLPGVGAFEAGIGHLREKELDHTVLEFVKTGKPVLGVCLGMQILLTNSYENGEFQGLDIIPGEVIPLERSSEVKIPQIGWNSLHADSGYKGTLLEGLPESPFFYFLHSYQVRVDNNENCLAKTVYGVNTFSSVIRKDNVTGCQFHPEVSGANGLLILKNFAQNA